MIKKHLAFVKALFLVPVNQITQKNKTMKAHFKQHGWKGYKKVKKTIPKIRSWLRKYDVNKEEVKHLHSIYKLIFYSMIGLLLLGVMQLIVTILLVLQIIVWYLYGECPVRTIEDTIEKKKQDDAR